MIAISRAEPQLIRQRLHVPINGSGVLLVGRKRVTDAPVSVVPLANAL